MTSSPKPTTTANATATATPIPSHPAHNLLSRAHSPDTASRIFTDKVRNKPLLLRPTSSSDRDGRALRRHVRLRRKEYYLRKRKPRPLSAKEKREMGVFELNKKEINHDLYGELHRMWNSYMLEVLGYTKDGKVVEGRLDKTLTAQGSGGLLASADFHGATVQVVSATDVGKVGIRGIVVRDTKYTFVLVTNQNETKTIPKKDCVFRYHVELPPREGPGEPTTDTPNDVQSRQDDPKINNQVDDDKGVQDDNKTKRLTFELHGNQFEFRPADRANRKFKWKVTDYL